MALELIPLFVNEVPSINSDNFNICYNAVTDRVYQMGIPASSQFGEPISTKQDGTTGELLLSVDFEASMPVSGNIRFNFGSIGICNIVTNESGSHVFGVTENSSNTNRGISRWDVTDLLEDAHVLPAVAIGTTHSTMLSSFTLDGVEYVAMAYPARYLIINAATMAAVFDSSYSVTGDLFYTIVGEQPTSATQALYTITQSGTRLRLYRHIFNGSTFTSTTLIFNWLASAVDPLWPSSFSSSPQPYLPMFDRSDNTIIMVVGQSGGGSSDTSAYLLKVNPTTGAIIWKQKVPNNYHWSMTSAPSVIDGTLRFVPGMDSEGYTFPWTTPSETVGTTLVFDTSDGSFTEEIYPEFGNFGNANAQRAYVYFGDEDFFLVYDAQGTNGYGNGWLAFAQAAEPPEDATIGGSGMQLEPMGCIVRAQPYALEVRDINSIIELGPFRFVEQKESDETSMITTLVLGLTEVDTGLLIEIDLSLASDLSELNQVFGAIVDLDDQVDVLGDDVEIDMGEGVDNSDDFTLELLGNDDGSTYPGPPIEFKPEVLQPIDDRGSTKQYSPTGYSFLYHRVRLKATEIDEKFQVKFVDISGQLTGRLF